jgi:calcineurin-like phosphoesterase family protein
MDDSLIANHNSIVRPDDHVIHIGDICFGTWKTLTGILRRLNGTHYLMDGSHDRALAEYINLDSDERPQDLIPKVRLLPKLFEFTYQGEKIVLCHYAMATWWSSHHGSYHFHGHSHGKFPHPGRAIDVGVDSPQITNPLHPILIDEAMKIVDKKKPKGEPHKKTP